MASRAQQAEIGLLLAAVACRQTALPAQLVPFLIAGEVVNINLSRSESKYSTLRIYIDDFEHGTQNLGRPGMKEKHKKSKV